MLSMKKVIDICRVAREMEPFDWNEYFWYLKSTFGNNASGRSRDLLFRELMRIPYTYEEGNNDINRAMDGKNLRIEVSDIFGQYLSEEDLAVPASVLEVMCSLANRIDRDILWDGGDHNPGVWMEKFLDNLKLRVCYDDCFNEDYVRQQVDIWLHKKYDRRGNGGLFPLRHSNYGDQRKLELWSQMNCWIHENYAVVQE